MLGNTGGSVLAGETSRQGAVRELKEETGIGVSEEELIMAMESSAQVESLQKTIYQSDGSDIALEDKLPYEKDEQEEVLDKLLLEDILGSLNARERELIYLRFFKEKTQTSIAKMMGMSQVQVSRLEKKILKALRERI